MCCSEQFNLTCSIHLFTASVHLFGVTGNLLPFFKRRLFFSLSVRAQPFNSPPYPFLAAATHSPLPHPTAQLLQGHAELIVYA